MELTVESLIAELGLELASGHEAAHDKVDKDFWRSGGGKR